MLDGELELGVGEGAHLGHVHALDLHRLRSERMPPFMTLFWILKKAKAMPKITVQIMTDADGLGAELAEPSPRSRSPKIPVTPLPDSAHVAVGGAVPAGAVGAVGEDADGQHAEGAADAVDGDGAHRVVDAPALDEAGGDDDEHAGDARR